MKTPWGIASSKTKLAEGIVAVRTPSHGGIWLSEDRIKQLPKGLANFIGDARWWEEDCDWCVPYIIFEDDIEAYGKASHFTESLAAAYNMARHCHPEMIAYTI